MRRHVALALLTLTAGLVGCLGSEDPGSGEGPEVEQPPVAERLAAMTTGGGDHDHANPTHHNVSVNATLLDHLRLVDEGPSGTHALALAGDTLFAASTLMGDHGFYAIDVSEPSNLEVVGEWHDERAQGGDRAIAATEDGSWVVLGTEGNVSDEEAGVRLFDASDPTDPSPVAFLPLDGGAHTVDVMTFDGTTYVFALNYGVQILRVADTPSGTQLLKVGHWGYAGPEMSDVPEYDNPGDYSAWSLRSVYAHDMKPVDDPEAGPLLYVAYAYQGMHVLDVSQPSSPQLVTRWVPPGEASPWYTHTVDAQWIGDQRVVVVGSEVFENRHNDTPSPVWVLDGSDLENPQLASTWTNPAGTGAQNLLFSAHFFRIEEGYLHLSHYHGGSWVLDLTTPERRADPPVVGAYLPHHQTGYSPTTECCFGWNLAGIPVTMDAVGDGDVTFAADVQTGVYAIRTDGIAS